VALPDDTIRAIAKERGQPYEQVAAEFGQPVLEPAVLRGPPGVPEPIPVAQADAAPVFELANDVDAAIATPVGVQADLAPVDAALAAPLGAQVAAEPVAPVAAPEPVQPVQVQPADATAPADAGQPRSMAQFLGGFGGEAAPAAPQAPEVAEQTEAPAATTDATETEQAPAETEELAPLSLQPSLTSSQEDLATIERDATGATMRMAEADEAAAKERAASAKKFLAEFDADMAKGMSEIDAAREGIKRNQEELRAANEEIAKLPPIKDSRSGLEKVFGALTMAIGGMQDQNNLVAGLMQGMNVQTNNAEQAAARVRESVERDISLQKTNYEKVRDKREAKLTEYGIARQLLGDSQQALRYATAMRGERFAAEMEAQAATLKSQTARDAGVLRSSELRMKFHESRNDILKAELGVKGYAMQAIALGKMTAAQAAEFIASGGSADGAPTKAELAAQERKRQADLLKLSGGNATQRGSNQVEDAESSYDDFVKTKPADWYNEKRTTKADDARSSYSQLNVVYTDAANALKTIKDPKATSEEKLDALTTYNEAREAVPQLLVAALGGGAAAEGEAARASKNWPTVPNPNLGDGVVGSADDYLKENYDSIVRNIDARPRAIEVSLNSVTRRHYAVMSELGHRHKSLAGAQPPAADTPASPTPAQRPSPAPSAAPKRRLTAADL
jgi:hypothetical protein